MVFLPTNPRTAIIGDSERDTEQLIYLVDEITGEITPRIFLIKLFLEKK